jgi:hypothetical protein
MDPDRGVEEVLNELLPVSSCFEYEEYGYGVADFVETSFEDVYGYGDVSTGITLESITLDRSTFDSVYNANVSIPLSCIDLMSQFFNQKLELNILSVYKEHSVVTDLFCKLTNT